MGFFDPEAWVRNLLKTPSARDKQVKIGASNMSDPCTYCLARAMQAGGSAESNPWWLGARIGTAIHNDIDRVNNDPDTLGEVRVSLGTIPGYGEVKSTSDLFHVPSGNVVDFKTTTRDKVKFLKRAVQEEPSKYEVTDVTDARKTIQKYQNQTHLYGLGLENAGHKVNKCALVFICRDGKTDADIWGYTYPYNRELALGLFDRAARLWAWLEAGNDIETLNSAQGCFACRGRE